MEIDPEKGILDFEDEYEAITYKTEKVEKY